MHLKRLELCGFKTFADRTELEFMPGVTAVVGPNGSGKSNIADAVQWVLGEQSMRSLRGLSSQDVIFAGTHRRKPLGFAEAHLTFDNSCGTLPLPFDEVTISRRLFRSGESDYRINKVSCRLRDIVELFLDTGIGAGAYAIIGQGEVDAVLSAKSEDRRALVEEAAGIKKYRVRKREAARKLEATQANLTRVTDITAEIERQLPPMRAQAEVARRYRELRDRARSLERALLMTEHRRALQQVARVRAACQAASDRAEAALAALSRVESEAEAARFAAARADAALDEARAAFAAASQQAERTRGNLNVSRERLAAVESAEESAAARVGELTEALERLRRQRQETTGRIAAAEAAERAAATALRARETELAGVNARIAEASAAREKDRRLAVERAQALTNAQAELRSAARRATDLRQAAERAAQRLAGLDAREETQDAREETLKAKLADAAARSLALNEGIRRAEAARATLQRAAHLRSQQIADTRTEATARAARLRTLRELDEKGEGYREGARAVLQAQRDGRLKGRFVPVAELLEVAPEYEPAIHAALGDDLDALVAGSMDEAREAIRFLRREGGGRATFVTPGACGGEPPRPDDPAEIVRRCAANHVRCDEAHLPAIRALLGDAVVVRHLDEARQVLSLDHARYRAVTLEGDLLHPRGILRGGRENGTAASLLSRRREMASLQEEVAGLEASLAELRAEGEAQAAELRAAETSVRHRREEAARAASDQAAAQKDLDYAARERQRLVEERRRSEAGIRHAEADREKAAAQEARLRQHVQSLQGQGSGDDDERARALLDELARERDSLSDAVSELKVAAARARQQAESLRESAARDARQEGEALTDLERRRAGSGERAERIRSLRDEIAGQEAERAALADALEQSQRRLDDCREERRKCLAVSGQIEQEVKEARERLGAAQQELHRAEVKLAGVESDIQHARTALFEQYGLTAAEVERASAEGEATEVRNRQQAGQELRQLHARMAELGEVNLGAIEELKRLEERLAFLCAQRDDLTEAREGLLRVIAEVDAETRERYLRTLEALRAAFDEVFTRLFGGGTTSLQFSGGDDVLEGGLDIIAQPPGKKPQSLLLLSGGERALTAAAFLFALLKIKPSPFVLLDEVDAPLDQGNVQRFCALLREFAQRSQFVVITHNPATTEAADFLYGIAMPEAGVSKMVSVRLEEVPVAA
ncbi:MAG: chromosome segregation protein SMC [Armatimonadetes bacterium]|nr:chromosome segregation protein SMC [Armatimonadota bacterium]